MFNGGDGVFTLERTGRMSLQEVERRRVFMSAVICRNDHNQLCIVGCQTPYFQNYGRPYVEGQIVTKVHIGKAIIRAHQRGRMVPNESDSFDSQRVRFRVVDATEINMSQPMEVYLLS